jgi:transcriptional accessory protein Tex/SPT6
MIKSFTPLEKIKVTRETIVLGALRAKREQLTAAIKFCEDCKSAVQASFATLADRETAVFAEIMQRVVATAQIDTVKESVLLIYKDHQQLEDELELAVQQCQLLTQEVADAHRAYQEAQRAREKFTMILKDFIQQRASLAEQEEEAEMEDLFCNRRPQFA